jgi:hypothetical protein
MAHRGLTTSIPIWVRVSGIIVLVLVGVVVSSMLLGGSGIGDHGPARHTTPSGNTTPASVTHSSGPGGHTPPDGLRDH